MTDSCQLMSRQLIIEPLSTSPRIYYLRNFLSHQECDELVEYAKPRVKKSTTVDPETGIDIVVDSRTSESTPLTLGETELVQRIELRIANLVNIPPENGEGLQVIHYNVGEEYQPHFDFFDPMLKGSHVVLRAGGQRIISVLMYLSDVEAGGETDFPKINLKVTPCKGNAVLFYNLLPDGNVDRLTMHAGMPVTKGEKWLATKWIRQNAFHKN